jgi:hypothetical protein
MNAREAKDFLVNETAEQASRDGVALSDLEKRMMYFTESDHSSESPVELNGEFEAQYDSSEYEAKIGKLLRRAESRLKREKPVRARRFSEALRCLAKGDHYLSVLWEDAPRERPPHDQVKLLVAGLSIVVLVLLLGFNADRISPQFATFIHDPVGGRVLFYGLLAISCIVFYFFRQKMRN